MFNSDTPISNENDDELNRMPFVKRLSKSICNYDSQNCLVIGLMGEWGCGKTSILNLTFNEIKNERDDWILIDFDPWYFSNQDNLILQFFNRLLNELKFSDKITNEVKNSINKFIKGLSISLNLKFISANLKLEDILEKEEFQKFNSFKLDLIDIFSELDYKIIISIDNIDRLTTREIKQIFFLVKSLADFPNVIYILSFDKEYVKSMINKESYNYEEFIKKIIQIPIMVPTITESRLDGMIFELIEPIYINNVDVGNKFLNNGFLEFSRILKPFFKNIRDLKRYVNIINFYIDIFEDKTFVDFMIIKALELFEYETYLKIAENKELLTVKHLNHQDMDPFDLNSSVYTLRNNLCKLFKNYDVNKSKDLLRYLFPIFDGFEDEEYFYNVRLVKYADDKFRICNKEYFDKYFTLSLEETEVSEDFINMVLRGNDAKKLSNIFLNLRDEHKLKYFFDKLFNKINEIPNDNYCYFVKSFLEIGDELLEDELINKNNQVHLLLKELFNRIDSTEKCFNILKNALNQSKNLFTPIEYVYSIGEGYGAYSSALNKPIVENQCVDFNQFKKLEKMAYNKIIELNDLNELQNYNKLKILLIYWEKIGSHDEVQSFVNRITQDDEDLIKFLSKFKTGNNTTVSRRFNFDFKELRKYFDLKQLDDRIKNIIEKTDNIDEKEFCRYFLSRSHRKKLHYKN